MEQKYKLLPIKLNTHTFLHYILRIIVPYIVISFGFIKAEWFYAIA